jgi:tetratricopeptide (TPR) repeat protein
MSKRHSKSRIRKQRNKSFQRAKATRALVGSHKITYQITYDPLVEAGDPRLPDEVTPDAHELYSLVASDPAAAIARLEPLLQTYPHNPTLENWLLGAYNAAGQFDKADTLCEDQYRRTPDYLFARCAYADLCIRRGQLDRVDEIFNKTFDLRLLYPHRTKFHISEFVNFMYIVVRYYLQKGEPDTAYKYFRALKEVAPDNRVTLALETHFLDAFTDKAIEEIDIEPE